MVEPIIMKVFFSRNFDKQYQKLSLKIQLKFAERLTLLLDNQDHPLLKVHELKGTKVPLLSMNVTADYRALFLKERDNIFFQEIGTHSELY